MKIFGKLATAPMLTHLHHKLAHAIRRLLLNNDMMHVYTNGVAIQLFDTIMRLLFPWFLFYSADYPEK